MIPKIIHFCWLSSDPFPKEVQEYMYSFITPVDHNTDIREAMKSENLKVLQRFNSMVKSEFSVGE